MNVSVVVSLASCLALTCVCVWLLNENRKLQSHFWLMKQMNDGLKIIVDAFIEQGAIMVCSVCGNPMEPNQPIDIVEQRDGTFKPSHSSHGLGRFPDE